MARKLQLMMIMMMTKALRPCSAELKAKILRARLLRVSSVKKNMKIFQEKTFKVSFGNNSKELNFNVFATARGNKNRPLFCNVSTLDLSSQHFSSLRYEWNSFFNFLSEF